ncbi:hypothetical protein L207DRAFT_57451 [Hyaloscypha variabilis F]|uniref:Uncharacterized protein n=1 Tax=Hyaloscypha variabilis (strain UAMH 11265 / GT02V1 / F) TaxID=1149755 RepID=A0A2J6RH46_HYAVF|nr:hypothetical protein L207DRAFT_57451 [Hyaloscypha variabilis F]
MSVRTPRYLEWAHDNRQQKCLLMRNQKVLRTLVLRYIGKRSRQRPLTFDILPRTTNQVIPVISCLLQSQCLPRAVLFLALHSHLNRVLVAVASDLTDCLVLLVLLSLHTHTSSADLLILSSTFVCLWSYTLLLFCPDLSPAACINLGIRQASRF